MAPHILAMTLGRGRGQLKCDGTRADTRFRLSAKRTRPFKSAEASVQSTTGSRGVRISGSNAGYTMFRGSVNSTGDPLHLPVSPSRPVRHRVPSHFNWTLLINNRYETKNVIKLILILLHVCGLYGVSSQLRGAILHFVWSEQPAAWRDITLCME
jgi:hypothetical protein